MGKPKCGILGLALAGLLLLAPVPRAAAQAPAIATDTEIITPSFCKATEDLIAWNLDHEYEPVGHAAWIDPDDALQRWRTENGDWLIMLSRSDGRACNISAGDQWKGESFVPGQDS